MHDNMLALLSGDLSPSARIWTALAPALFAVAYFLVGLVLFCIRCAIKGIPRDEETLTRGKSVLVGFFLRHYFFWVIQPLWRVLLRSGLPANALSMLSGLLGVSSGVAVAAGRFALGGWLFLLAGVLDVMDGRVARTRKEANPAGAALDSVLDRYVDSAILMGLAWYYRDTWVLLPALGALMGSSLVPYVRAKGEGLGVSVRDGAMQRLERVLFLGVGTALSPILEALFWPTEKHPMHWLAVAGLVFVAVLSNVTALARFRTLVRALTPKKPVKQRSGVALFGFNAAAGAIATAVDFVAVLGMVEWGGISPVWATVAGCVLGGVVNYSINRVITFRSQGAVAPQLARYTLVSATSALLNAGGVALLTLHPQLAYTLGWWLVRGVVYFAWNLPLQRDYVFNDNSDELLEQRPHAA
ncbi:GtrA family protein [Corallococcus exiguus]|uniref:CDP-alcohol phosphatidyltransferase n=2 Tax=Myxococcaceae TaxID=31 RepID=A0A7Y1SB53_9BACT|nr:MULTISPECIES: GtrA family protein [Corallococcus]RKI41594.1 CDP-alcohol phosphatidyltransferase [Corallococcus sp. AB004]NBC38488.1 CDP-alcohol phosphatidyltransferase [Corallococcus exiguus]NNB91232.1 CDP-alcohol phosphatidyltransferase [Corallococcus exiguus]NNB99279.1 CDP-alcohol phosphatidyltransferase [Corallococcus exiguus]NNC07869.1 CDP-alcohol phosphatidyltransferase [Corallococcus exiguus]